MMLINQFLQIPSLSGDLVATSTSYEELRWGNKFGDQGKRIEKKK